MMFCVGIQFKSTDNDSILVWFWTTNHSESNDNDALLCRNDGASIIVRWPFCVFCSFFSAVRSCNALIITLFDLIFFFCFAFRFYCRRWSVVINLLPLTIPLRSFARTSDECSSIALIALIPIRLQYLCRNDENDNVFIIQINTNNSLLNILSNSFRQTSPDLSFHHIKFVLMFSFSFSFSIFFVARTSIRM